MINIKESARGMILSFLGITPASDNTVQIKESMTHRTTVLKNRIWYRGDPVEIEQFFKQIANESVSKARFWAAVPSEGTIRKFHTGLYSDIINKLVDMVLSDLSKIDIEKDEEALAAWEEIAKDNKFAEEVLREAITETLVTGDGVFKFTLDSEVSKYPIIEFISGENVKYNVQRGRLQEVIFETSHKVKEKTYKLVETYGKGFITYKLYESDKEVPLTSIKETEALKDGTFTGSFIMALPLSFWKSAKYPGRGNPLLDKKSDNFDSLDEVVSQWIEAIRDGKVKSYIPADLLPKNPQTGEPIRANSFDSKFISIGTNMAEDAKNMIQQNQADINYEAFVTSYASMLDLCLQGVISPATLGIDLKKTDNATAQREKEKTTLATRQKMVDTLNEVIPVLINMALKVSSNLGGTELKDYEASVTFGEYASPSFNEKVEVISKAASSSIMSIERQVDELWGDTMTEDEQTEEVQRIKEMKGILTVDEPAAGIDGLNQNLTDPITGKPIEKDPEDVIGNG